MLYVAPMMAWTDRHCRYLHRLFAPSAQLFTEMVTTGALLHGNQWHQLDYNPEEHPVALQLGGNDPDALARCTKRAFELGYDEVNLNVGCPSDRVQNGAFGACLMKAPGLVAACVEKMVEIGEGTVSVKCRLGVDGADSDEFLHHFIDRVSKAGCQKFYVHARIAILSGLSPAQNREIPPLQPQRVKHLKSSFPDLDISINGGITTLDGAVDHLNWADGVMLGRAAYHDPGLLTEIHRYLVDQSFFPNKLDILSTYAEYAQVQFSQGVRLQPLIKPLLGACNGMPGARKFRRTLSDHRRLQQGDTQVFSDAFSHVFREAA